MYGCPGCGSMMTFDIQGQELKCGRCGRTESIAEADQRSMDGETCFYVLTLPDEQGESLACWVGVDTGLLLAAERRRGDSVLYRMAVSEYGEPEDEAFELPDR